MAARLESLKARQQLTAARMLRSWNSAQVFGSCCCPLWLQHLCRSEQVLQFQQHYSWPVPLVAAIQVQRSAAIFPGAALTEPSGRPAGTIQFWTSRKKPTRSRLQPLPEAGTSRILSISVCVAG